MAPFASLLRLSTATLEMMLKAASLSLIFVIAFVIRLFSVLRYEAVIHEFDPYFNFRTTTYLVEEGWYEFWNWFDDMSWYPLGRIIGFTIYPGLMGTAAYAFWFLRLLNISIEVRHVCVFLAPFFASMTSISMYLLGAEIRNAGTGLIAAAFIALVPGYISRSVAGSYDNEGVAIWALITVFYLFVKSVNTGSMMWSAFASLMYFYMTAAWGGYIFIINLIPLYVLIMIITGRYSSRLYVAYSVFYILGTFLSMQIRFVGFQAVQSGEHMAALCIFGLIQVVAFFEWLRCLISDEHRIAVFRLAATFAIALTSVIFGGLTVAGYISPWTGRFWTLLDPTYAKEHIPIIASVSEHQPTTWASFFFDLHILLFLFPAGLYFCFCKLNDGNIFIIIYGMTSVYFAGVMVRLMLVLSPVACVISSVAVSATLLTYMTNMKIAPEHMTKKQKADMIPGRNQLAFVMIVGISMMLFLYVFHCSWVTSEAYSSPSIVLAAKQPDGSRLIFDDFREAYYWIRQNTPEDSKILSWWDYGYQLTSISNRTVIVDNNTWNNTHIATIGKIMASDEETAYGIMRSLDADYVLMIFGGLTGYASDDMNKFLWMIRIAGSIDPSIKEEQYYSSSGEFKMDKDASPKLLDSLMYKLSYYRFGEVLTDPNTPSGYDRVRQQEIGRKNFELEHLEEAYTSEHWIVRVYKVKKPENRW